MKKHTLFFMALYMFLGSCTNPTKSDNDNSANDTQDSSAQAVEIMIPQSGCFAFYTAQDTFLLKTEVFPNVVTGVLKYQFFEKDKSEGTLEGKLDGNKLIADYTFNAEGKSSVRQVAFLFENNQAIEGYGEMIEENNKLIFKDTAAIDFTRGMRFDAIDCVGNDQIFN